jgi:hypothetical protein
MIGNDTGRTPPPLSPLVEALLKHERAIAPQPEMVRTRAFARAREALHHAEVAPLSSRRTASPVRRLTHAAAAGVVLMAGAAAAYQMLRQSEPPRMPAPGNASRAAALKRAPLPPAETTPEALPAQKASSAHQVPAVPALAPRTPGPSRRPGLSGRSESRIEELRLLDRARRSDARGDYPAVLALLAEHERSYPTGRLSEEREVLRVKALVGLGRGNEARQVASKFRRQFPRSVLLGKIQDMLASLR